MNDVGETVKLDLKHLNIFLIHAACLSSSVPSTRRFLRSYFDDLVASYTLKCIKNTRLLIEQMFLSVLETVEVVGCK